MYYLLITTTKGKINLGNLGVKYRTKKTAEQEAEKAKKIPGTIEVKIMKTA